MPVSHTNEYLHRAGRLLRQLLTTYVFFICDVNCYYIFNCIINLIVSTARILNFEISKYIVFLLIGLAEDDTKHYRPISNWSLLSQLQARLIASQRIFIILEFQLVYSEPTANQPLSWDGHSAASSELSILLNNLQHIQDIKYNKISKKWQPQYGHGWGTFVPPFKLSRIGSRTVTVAAAAADNRPWLHFPLFPVDCVFIFVIRRLRNFMSCNALVFFQ